MNTFEVAENDAGCVWSCQHTPYSPTPILVALRAPLQRKWSFGKKWRNLPARALHVCHLLYIVKTRAMPRRSCSALLMIKFRVSS